ncbi:MAG: DUF2080 family transposase-associated protein [Methanomicrobiales archaeon]|nr:DUF2080 family transposase-associated protein [Methanomicrobiales archaeon]
MENNREPERPDPITVRVFCDEKGKRLLRALLPDPGDFGATRSAQVMIPVDWEQAPEGAYILWGDADVGVVYADVYGADEDFAEHVRQALQSLADGADAPSPSKYEVAGYEMIEKTVAARGNSGGVYVPPSWVGKRVAVIRRDP